MKYLCHCGSISYTQLANLGRLRGCVECGGSKKKTIEEIKEYFKDNNCELLSTTYNDSLTPLSYRCSCGNISTILWGHFRVGVRCRKCYIERNSGENHYRWNNELSIEEKSINVRISAKYQRWKRSILIRDNYLCRKCGCDLKKYYTGVHHIREWLNNVDDRYNIENGISFCQQCHNLFHSKYKKNNNNIQQLKEYLNER